MSNTLKMKLYPQVISKVEYKTVKETDFLKTDNMIAYDDDNDSWVIGMYKYFFINLTEFNKDIDFSREGLNSDNINEILDKFYKSRNLGLKNELVLYLDHIETHQYMKRCGIGTKMLNHIKNIAYENGCKAIILNANPVITFNDGIKREIKKTDLNKKIANLKNFYIKRNFEPINKTSTLMYYKL